LLFTPARSMRGVVGRRRRIERGVSAGTGSGGRCPDIHGHGEHIAKTLLGTGVILSPTGFLLSELPF
jgi:hypothetical protein